MRSRYENAWKYRGGCRLAKERPERTHNLGTEHHQVDDHNTNQHHHRVTLDLFGTFGSFLFQIVLLDLTHIEGNHFEVHPLVITAQDTNQATDHIGQHGAANAGFKSNEGIFIVAGLHISNGLIQFGAEVFPSHTAVGSQNFKYIPVIFKALADGQSKSGNLALDQLAALFNKIKGCIVG